MIWQLKKSSLDNYETMLSPSEMSIDGEDIDLDSYRSVVTGNTIRQILGFKWQKISFKFNLRSEEDAAEFIHKFENAHPLYIKIQSPIMSTNGYVELRGYISKIHVDARINKNGNGLAWSVSFNFVESER